ncbi:TonB-dependent receptor [Psychroflexus sp. CAK8W]|uniref:TonB-dependent receptor n=1 Tax=Psychroflexus longus TaxID=2873596 RepID=A0ABS7XGV6_9FLAO|nr:TonB-dependent receptor [Psychroflexus longus]MBZ9777744.1 TonB-dependent receptor [Psychroflexus longus]
MKKVFSFLFLMFCLSSFSQTVITGTVKDNSGIPLPGANVIVMGSDEGTTSNFDGKFELKTDRIPPFDIVISFTGFENSTVNISSKTQTIEVELELSSQLDEVVISASRTPERVFESPVTIERFGINEVRNTASADFYGGLENLKGVDINKNSLTFSSVNTRGFAGFANARFMQLVDGMDNSAPALNFPLGNLIGMIETDVQSVEILPGASSGLYGANAFNGILFMRSKNPFEFSGISGYVKQGITSQEAAGDNSFTDVGIRLAHKFSDKFAAKVNLGYLKGTDWWATNQEDKLGRGLTRADTDYDGINIYGDEVSTNIRSASGLGIIPDVEVSRTGYNEVDLTNYNAESLKADWGLYYRPWEDDFEIQYVGKIGSGNTIYQGANRYNIKDFVLQQHKIEVKNNNFFFRTYVNIDDAGNSYDMVFTGININRSWKSDADWFGDYIQTFAGIELSGNPQGLTTQQKHDASRAAADTGRLIPGTPEFQNAFDQVIQNPDLSQGSKFQDNSRFYHSDANYNFGHLWDFAEVQAGGSLRVYELNSGGTIYTDNDGSIGYSEFGLYTQIQKDVELSDLVKLKLTGSLRYDKSELFDGFFSPRLSAGFTIAKDHNIRASFQTGFRNPTTQDLYIGLDVGRAVLIGSAFDNPARYSKQFSVAQGNLSSFGAAVLGSPTLDLDGTGAYENSFTANSVSQDFSQSGNPADLEIGNSSLATPEQVSSFELGYRGKIEGFVIDASVYHNIYQDFLSNENVLAPFYGDVELTETVPGTNTPLAVAAIANGDFQVFQTYTNTEEEVRSYGGAIGLSTKVFGGFDLSSNYTYALLDFDVAANPNVRLGFNTPEHQVKTSFGHTDLFENFGFNVAWRWRDSYFWEASFGDGIVPSFNVFDAQVNYRIPKYKSTLKLGAANILQDEYFTAFGTGFIGSQYYISLTINNF